MHDLPLPALGPGDVLVEVLYSGICGSELSGFLGSSSIRTPPLVFGHEVSGLVAAIAPDVSDRRSLAVGDRVTVNPLVSCGSCRYCLRGRQQLCRGRLLLGASLPGANAGYVAVPSTAILPVPDGLHLQSAAMVEPVAFAMHAVEVSGVRPTSSALVVGAGAIGLFIPQVLGASDIKDRYVVERNPQRMALAIALGCTPVIPGDEGVPALVRELTDGWGVDVAFDAVGTETTRGDCLAAVAAGGVMVLAGLHSDATSLPLNSVIRSEITLTGAFAYSPTNFSEALKWLADGRVGLTEGVVVAPLSEGQRWFERLVQGDPSAKVLLQPTRN